MTATSLPLRVFAFAPKETLTTFSFRWRQKKNLFPKSYISATSNSRKLVFATSFMLSTKIIDVGEKTGNWSENLSTNVKRRKVSCDFFVYESTLTFAKDTHNSVNNIFRRNELWFYYSCEFVSLDGIWYGWMGLRTKNEQKFKSILNKITDRQKNLPRKLFFLSQTLKILARFVFLQSTRKFS